MKPANLPVCRLKLQQSAAAAGSVSTSGSRSVRKAVERSAVVASVCLEAITSTANSISTIRIESVQNRRQRNCVICNKRKLTA